MVKKMPAIEFPYIVDSYKYYIDNDVYYFYENNFYKFTDKKDYFQNFEKPKTKKQIEEFNAIGTGEKIETNFVFAYGSPVLKVNNYYYDNGFSVLPENRIFKKNEMIEILEKIQNIKKGDLVEFEPW